MSATIPFAFETFTPISIKGNKDNAANPVTFEICSVGGAARVNLKSIIHATEGLADMGPHWPSELQRSTAAAFSTGPACFVDGITAIHNLTASTRLFLKVGLIDRASAPKDLDLDGQIPVTSGVEFSRLCGHFPLLAFEVAMAIARLCEQSEIDPRFFDWLSTLRNTSGGLPGNAPRVESKRARRATAGSKTPRGGRRATT